MPYKDTKIYSDGYHYIAIPKTGKTGKKGVVKRHEGSNKTFDTIYESFAGMSKKEKIKKVKETLSEIIPDKESLNQFVKDNMERRTKNRIVRWTRLMRKVYLQEWNYFCTFTYDDKLHTEESFKKSLSNCLRHLATRKGWKYIGVWERSPEKKRLHFHGIFYIPEMIGTLEEHRDFDTKNKKMQTTYQNSHFLKQFGRNDFKDLEMLEDVEKSVRYLIKYIEKSNERLIISRGLPTYFVSDIMDDDVICRMGMYDQKLLLFDNFDCWLDGEYMGKVSKETIQKLKKVNT